VLNLASTLVEMMNVLADLTLVFQSGTSWEYSAVADGVAGLD
jgi:hypothetical protein